MALADMADSTATELMCLRIFRGVEEVEGGSSGSSQVVPNSSLNPVAVTPWIYLQYSHFPSLLRLSHPSNPGVMAVHEY